MNSVFTEGGGMVAGIQGQDDKVTSQRTDPSLGASCADCDGVLEDVVRDRFRSPRWVTLDTIFLKFLF